ncbi:MAG: hypothetical protein AAF664_03875, partial [Planctomycetota bacterium]
MLGPIFVREASVLPRRSRTYVARGVYLLAFLILLCTGYLVLDGARTLASAGDAARFGRWMFTLLVPLQWLILTAMSAVGSASSVAQEKDRRTLILLLLTRLTGSQIVAGKLASTLLTPFSLLLCVLPLLMTLPWLGGVWPTQVWMAAAVTGASILLSGAIGTVVGLWREKSFQAIALTVLILTMHVAIGESVARASGSSLACFAAPISTLTQILSPLATLDGRAVPFVATYIVATLTTAIALTGFGIYKVRIWNPSREVRLRPQAIETSEEALHASEEAGTLGEIERNSWRARAPKPVWDNPILWREICTWAYGRKVILIRIAFAFVFALIAAVVYSQVQSGVALERAGQIGRALPASTIPLTALGVISLVLVNALAVNSITGERDGLALDLLLVTDLSAKEFVFGKILGVMYVAKELILLPLALIVMLGLWQVVTIENMVYLLIGSVLLYIFVITLGIHLGLHYLRGQTATLTSLGTVFFLCVGIAVCMTIMVSFRGAFQLQLPPFLIMTLGGGAALFAALGLRNPSSAL